MYELVEVCDHLYLAKRRGDDPHYTTVATFMGEPHEIRSTALEIVNVLNAVGAAVLAGEKSNVFEDDDADTEDKADEDWKPAMDPSYDDTGA